MVCSVWFSPVGITGAGGSDSTIRSSIVGLRGQFEQFIRQVAWQLPYIQAPRILFHPSLRCSTYGTSA